METEKVIQVGCTKYTEWNRQQYRVYSIGGISPCLNTVGGGGLEPKIRQMGSGFNKGGDHDISPTITSNSFECNNFVLGSLQKNAYKGTTDGVSLAITAACGMGGGQTPMIGNNYRIRKLTPRECFRLMGVDDADIDKLMSAGISNSQLYKCAGNSIVVDTLYHLFRKLFCDKESEEATYQQTLF